MANDFLPFAGTTTGSNLLTQSEYVADAQRPIGNQPGVARSKLVNKAIRQSAWIISELAKFLNTRTGNDVLDDQNSTNLQATMVDAWPAIVYPTNTFYQGYHDNSQSWPVASASYVDVVSAGTPVLVQRQTSGLTVVTASGNVPGITFTPASASAVYLITAIVGAQNPSGQGIGVQLTDGTTVIAGSIFVPVNSASQLLNSLSVTGVFVPGTASPVTVKLQAYTGGAAAGALGPSGISNAIEWTILRIK